MSKTQVCTHCYQQTKAKQSGSFVFEIVLWIFMIFPGLLYSIWRMTSQRKCQYCKSKSLVPIGSPKGQKIIKEHPMTPKEGSDSYVKSQISTNVMKVAIIIVASLLGLLSLMAFLGKNHAFGIVTLLGFLIGMPFVRKHFPPFINQQKTILIVILVILLLSPLLIGCATSPKGLKQNPPDFRTTLRGANLPQLSECILKDMEAYPILIGFSFEDQTLPVQIRQFSDNSELFQMQGIYIASHVSLQKTKNITDIELRVANTIFSKPRIVNEYSQIITKCNKQQQT